MAKVLLVNPVFREWSYPPNCVPCGLLYLSSVLREHGHHVDILDLNGHRYHKSKVADYFAGSQKYDCIGTTGLITSYKRIREIASLAKTYHPDTPVIVGGPISGCADILLENMPIDAVVAGEGELAILDVVNDAQNGCLRRTYQREYIMDLDAIPFPDYHNLDTLDVYLSAAIGKCNPRKWIDGKPLTDTKSILMTGSRGCPFNCKFCTPWGSHRWRARSPENIVEEMKMLEREFDVQYFVFSDDTFVMDRKRVHRFCDLLKEWGAGISWGSTGRINLMTKKLIQEMADSGCNYIGYGVESGSPKMLKLMSKQITQEQIKRTLRWNKDILGWNDFSLICGFPGETRETIQETIDFFKSINESPEVIFFAQAYKPSWLYSYAIMRGLIRDEAEYIESLSDHEQGDTPLINFTDMTDEELIAEKERMEKEIGAWEKS